MARAQPGQRDRRSDRVGAPARLPAPRWPPDRGQRLRGHAARARIASIFGWLEREVRDGGFSPGGGLGLSELALITALDWMTFRDIYKASAHPALVAVRAAHEGRSSLKATLPPA
ncbi:glutathione S-transferase C-terminal domain-containing protein [Sorangium sp. So ce1389]|uniref:glutathione S-transferase C-terminal domain-containing protein n=1 Tax=Sorangium sp. So ce1389 TaxID=3133336 RepID=UPI003F63B1F7